MNLVQYHRRIKLVLPCNIEHSLVGEASSHSATVTPTMGDEEHTIIVENNYEENKSPGMEKSNEALKKKGRL